MMPIVNRIGMLVSRPMISKMMPRMIMVFYPFRGLTTLGTVVAGCGAEDAQLLRSLTSAVLAFFLIDAMVSNADCFAAVAFAGGNDLSVACDQVEAELSVRRFLDFKLHRGASTCRLTMPA